MKQITVTIHVDPATAVRAGKSTVGDVALVLRDSDLESLTADQRETLARHVAGERCPSGVTDWAHPLYADAPPVAEATVAALTMLLDARKARIEQQLAETAEERAREKCLDETALANVIAYATSCPIDELATYNSAGTSLYILHNSHRDGRWPNAYDMGRNVIAAEAAGRADELCEHYKTAARRQKIADEAKLAETAVRNAAKEANMAECRLWLTEYAATHLGNPRLARGAKEGRDCQAELERTLVHRVKAVLEQLGYVTDTYGERELNDLPTERGYALLDAIRAAKTELIAAAALPQAEISDAGVELRDVIASGGTDYREGVDVTVSHPWIDRITVSVLVEAPVYEGDPD